jgi:hypothetical protein
VDKTILIPVLNLVASIAGVAVTTIYVVATWRYVRLFEKETKTRQIVQEEWEMRRFYASRLFAAADGFIDVFFASKRELEVFIGQAPGLLLLQFKIVLQTCGMLHMFDITSEQKTTIGARKLLSTK